MLCADSIYANGENDTVLFIPDLVEASAYFAEKKQFEKASLAALYNGFAEKDYDKDKAMESFKEAVRYGTLAHDSLTVAQAQFQMGKLLYYNGMIDEAITCFRDADRGFGHLLEERSLVFNMLAASFMIHQEFDSAATCLDQSLKYAEVSGSNKAWKKAMNNYAVLYQFKGDLKSAIECLRLVEPENDEQLTLNYLNLGDVFSVAGELDSAERYFRGLEDLLKRTKVKPETSCAAYKALSVFSERHGDLKAAITYRKEYERLLGTLMDTRKQSTVYRIQQKYDYESLQNAMNRKIAHKQRIIVIVCLLLALLSVSLAVTQRWLAVKTKQEAQARDLMVRYIQQYYALLEKQGKIVQKTAIVMEHKDNRMLLNDLISTVIGTKDPWDSIAEVLNSLQPEKGKAMERLHSILSELEWKDLLLSYFNVSRKDEALLLNTSIHSVDKLRQSVKKKLVNLDL